MCYAALVVIGLAAVVVPIIFSDIVAERLRSWLEANGLKREASEQVGPYVLGSLLAAGAAVALLVVWVTPLRYCPF
jgi:hypothetical protein